MKQVRDCPSVSLPSVSEPDKRLQALWVVCDQLPKNNKANLRWVTDGLVHTTCVMLPFFLTANVCLTCVCLCVLCCRYLVKFLSKLAQDSEVNKMTPSNIAIVLGPNLLWAKTEG